MNGREIIGNNPIPAAGGLLTNLRERVFFVLPITTESTDAKRGPYCSGLKEEVDWTQNSFLISSTLFSSFFKATGGLPW